MSGGYAQVIRDIDEAVGAAGNRQILVAIDGMCGSGKSTLGAALQEHYGCNLFHMDDFFLRPEQRTKERYAEPGGNVDYERFQAEILDHIADRQGLEYRVFDCRRMEIGGIVRVPFRQLNIIEGSYSQHPYFGDIYDLRFFLRITGEEQIRRIRRRNGEAMLGKFRDVWIPMENCYFEAFGIEEKSRKVE